MRLQLSSWGGVTSYKNLIIKQSINKDSGLDGLARLLHTKKNQVWQNLTLTPTTTAKFLTLTSKLHLKPQMLILALDAFRVQ